MILVTRHGSRLQETLETVKSSGFKAIGCGLMTTSALPLAPFPKTVKGVLITSPAALEAVPPTAVPLHCVGMRTAHLAQNMGFTVGITGRGGAQELAEALIAGHASCSLVHAAGDYADDAWYATLRTAGFEVTRAQAYKTEYLTKLPDDVVWHLRENEVSSIMLFSAKSAKLMADLLAEEGLDPQNFEAVCLSAAVAAQWPGKSLIAHAPTVEEMVQCLTTKKGCSHANSL